MNTLQSFNPATGEVVGEVAITPAINYPFLSEHDWYLDSIRGEARFAQAMERAKGEWDRLGG
jgi:hypothetical protein